MSRRLQILWAVAALVLPACSSGKRTPSSAAHVDDAGDSGAATGAPGADESSPTGTVSVKVEWLDPPAEVVSSPGINLCGQAIPPMLQVSALGAVQGVVVLAEGTSPGSPDAPAAVTIEGCGFSPRVQVARTGSEVTFENRDPRRHHLEVRAAGASPQDPPHSDAALPLVGQSVARVFDQPGSYALSLRGHGGARGTLYVASASTLSTTNEEGVAVLAGLPPGKHTIRLWHPAISAGSKPLTQSREVVVVAQETASVEMALSP